MPEGWSMRTLGDCLDLRRERVVPVANKDYKQVTVAIKGKGARLRRIQPGSEFKSSAQFRAGAGQLIISKIDARKGAAAVLDADLDGALVTSDFPMFAINHRVVFPAYLDLLVRQPGFARLCDSISAGTTNRVRMDLARFPHLMVALPPLAEQRCIVDLLQSADETLEAAQRQTRACRQAQAAIRESWGLTDGTPSVSVDEVLHGIEAGRSPVAQDRLPLPSERGVLKVSAVRFGRF